MGFHHPIRSRATSCFSVVFGTGSAHREIIHSALPGPARAPEQGLAAWPSSHVPLLHSATSTGHCHQQIISSSKQDQHLPWQLLPAQSQGTADGTHVLLGSRRTQLWNTLLVKEGLEKGAYPTVGSGSGRKKRAFF